MKRYAPRPRGTPGATPSSSNESGEESTSTRGTAHTFAASDVPRSRFQVAGQQPTWRQGGAPGGGARTASPTRNFTAWYHGAPEVVDVGLPNASAGTSQAKEPWMYAGELPAAPQRWACTPEVIDPGDDWHREAALQGYRPSRLMSPRRNPKPQLLHSRSPGRPVDAGRRERPLTSGDGRSSVHDSGSVLPSSYLPQASQSRPTPLSPRPRNSGRPTDAGKPQVDATSGSAFARLRRTAETLRAENIDLREEIESRSKLLGDSASTLGRGSPRQTHRQSDAAFFGDGAVAVEKLTVLTRDLRTAVGRSVEQRAQVERQLASAEEVHARRNEQLLAEVGNATMEVAVAQERRALDESRGQQALEDWARAKDAAAREDAAKVQELRAARSALDLSKLVNSELRERVRAAEEAFMQHRSDVTQLPMAAEEGHLQEIRARVCELQDELRCAEARHEDDDCEAASCWRDTLALPLTAASDVSALQARLEEHTRDNASRKDHLLRGQAEFQELQAQVLSVSSEASAEARAVEAARTELQAVRLQAESCKAEERLLSESAEPLRKELIAMSRRYEKQKRLLAVYTAAILRGPRVATRAKLRTRGVSTLVRALATEYGSPEVCFLSLDPRGSGRVNAWDLHVGLLLGARLDYEKLTGLTAQELLGPGALGAAPLTLADLGACCPEVWAEYGSKAPDLLEELRSLPWGAVGSAEKAFNQAVRCDHWSVAHFGNSGSDSDESCVVGGRAGCWSQPNAPSGAGLSRGGLEDIVAQRLKGIPAEEIDQLFGFLSRGGSPIPRDVWLRATEEVAVAPIDHDKAASIGAKIARRQPAPAPGPAPARKAHARSMSPPPGGAPNSNRLRKFIRDAPPERRPASAPRERLARGDPPATKRQQTPSRTPQAPPAAPASATARPGALGRQRRSASSGKNPAAAAGTQAAAAPRTSTTTPTASLSGEVPQTLHEASRSGDMRAIQQILRGSVDVNTLDAQHRTALHVAVREGQLDALRLLIDCRADLNLRDANYGVPLHGAAFNDQLEMVRVLCGGGATVDAKDDDGWTPLYICGMKGHDQVAQALLEFGADPRITASNGKGPLSLARQHGHTVTEKVIADAIAARGGRRSTPRPSTSSRKSTSSSVNDQNIASFFDDLLSD